MMELLKKHWALIGSILLMLFAILFAPGCKTVPVVSETARHEVVIKVEPAGAAKAKVGESLVRTMTVENDEGHLSSYAFLCGDEAFLKLYSGLTVGDVSSVWNDLTVLRKKTRVRKVSIFLNSPGGDAFSGLALADEIERAEREGFEITIYASGIVASAAVPIFAVCGKRIAAPGTIFMVHETSIWKWPGRETHSDIKSQNELMDLLRERYLGKLAARSKLSAEQWSRMEKKTTWFSARQAKEWGLVDEIR